MPSMNIRTISFVVLWAVGCSASAQAVDIRHDDSHLVFTIDDAPIATYVYRDEQIPRPYFADVKVPSGHQGTRNHPPIEGTDATDHATMHPGIWLAFGDLGGNDYWRNKARVVHHSFSEPPTGGSSRGRFVEQKHYLNTTGELVCRERFLCEIHSLAGGYLLLWDSTFDSDRPFYFGDQEEMGLGVRVATPLAEVNGGYLSDARGRCGAEAIWSQAAPWCDYRGQIDDVELGVTIMAHPDNFRTCWWHARDYGFMAANPFGRRAMNKGDVSRVVVEPGEKLRLRFGVWLHSQPAKPGRQRPCAEQVVRSLGPVYQKYLRLADQGVSPDE